MSRRQSWYHKHLTIYVNHTDLDKRLQDSNRTKSIIAFLRLGLIGVIIGILASIGGYIALLSNKTYIADGLQSYASGIIAQLPANMTGVLVISGENITLHLNNDKPFIVNLVKDTEQENNGTEPYESFTVMVDTSLTSMPSSSEHIMMIIQNAFAIKSDTKRNIYDFDEIDKENRDSQKTIALTQAMIQNTPAQITGLIEENMGSIIGPMMVIVLFTFIILTAIILVIIALRYFFLCFIIRCLVSIVVSVAKWEIPHNKRDIICILGFGPFLLHLFLVSSPLYVLAMTLFICFLIYQHRNFHQKK